MCLTFVVLRPSVRLWPAEDFVFAGLSLRTTIEAAQKRYPNSSIVGRNVYVSDVDSHDHIRGIELPQLDEPAPRIRVFFEQRGAKRNQYPRCEQITAIIKRAYGEPTAVQEFSEGRSRNRRLIWKRGDESLSLLCFQIGRQSRLAAEVAITSSPSHLP